MVNNSNPQTEHFSGQWICQKKKAQLSWLGVTFPWAARRKTIYHKAATVSRTKDGDGRAAVATPLLSFPGAPWNATGNASVPKHLSKCQCST